MKNTNFKKWGWWALGGLVVVILIAGFVIARSSGPEPSDSTDVADTSEGENNEAIGGGESQDKSGEEETDVVADNPPVDLPQSGPKDNLAGILWAGAGAYLVSFAIVSVVRSRKSRQEV